MLVAQTVAEYGAASAFASALDSLVYQFAFAVREPRSSVWFLIGAGALVWWLFFRSK